MVWRRGQLFYRLAKGQGLKPPLMSMCARPWKQGIMKLKCGDTLRGFCGEISRVSQLGQIHVLVKNGGELVREQLVEADAVVGVHPALPRPVVTLWTAVHAHTHKHTHTHTHFHQRCKVTKHISSCQPYSILPIGYSRATAVDRLFSKDLLYTLNLNLECFYSGTYSF